MARWGGCGGWGWEGEPKGELLSHCPAVAGVRLQELPPLGIEERLEWIPNFDGGGVFGAVAAPAGWRQVAGNVEATLRQGHDMLQCHLAAGTAEAAGIAE